MPLLSFQYLPVRNAEIEAVTVDWRARTAQLVLSRASSGGASPTVVEFQGVRGIEMALTGRTLISRCWEEAGRFLLETENRGLVAVVAAGYSVG